MSYKVFPFGDFSGGLNLRDKSDVVKPSEAIDLLNVDFTDVGAVRQRDGFLEFTGSSLTNRVDSLFPFYKAGGTSQLLAGCGTRLEALDSSGVVVASATGLTSGPYNFARFAAPGTETAYVANGSDTLRTWDGSAWAAPTGTVDGVGASALPKAGAICVTPNTNRLLATAFGTGVTSGPGGTASNPSRVYFSNVALPTTWETDGSAGRGRNFLDLTPGDGEQIMNAVVWRELVFVFKQSKFFVFQGEGKNADNTPLFQYRAVDTGVGLAAKKAVAVSPQGVFFLDRRGVYFTNGNEPVLLSEKIDPIFLGNPEVYFQSETFHQAQAALARLTWHNERIYLAIPTGSATANDRVLVYDTQRAWWTLYDLPAAALTSWRRTAQPELHFGYSSGTNRTGRLNPASTTDNNSAITSRWRSGWYDYDSPLVKAIRQSQFWGTGSLTVNYSRDFERATRVTEDVTMGDTTATWGDGTDPGDTWGDGTDSSDLWGGAGQIADVMSRQALRGTVFSTEFVNLESLSPTWSIHRVSRYLRATRRAGMGAP